MNKVIEYILLLFCLASCLLSCKKPYNPPAVTTNYNYLVVEGLINISDSTFIKLSRTVTIGSAATTKPELKAVITIESSTGTSYPLKETGNGSYAAPSYNLSPANQYRLRIRTSNANTYASDFVQTKISPPIDSLIVQAKSDALYFSLNTHDPKNATRYYRWDFEETWQFTSYFQSRYTAQYSDTAKSVQDPLLWLGSGIAVLPRKNDIYHCWGDNYSHLITLNNSAALSQDVIQNQPITNVLSSSEKLHIRYRINIRQYALNKDEYDFWTLLKKNTEQLGSIFDAQPTATVGNIHNINIPGEAVIGYIGVCSVSQKTIYLNYTDLPKSYVADYLNNTPYNPYTCQLDSYYIAPPDPNDPTRPKELSELIYFIYNYPYTPEIPIDLIAPVDINHVPLPLGGHTGALPACADCTERGTNVKPAFWQ